MTTEQRDYSSEWWYNHTDTHGRPTIGISLSGGGVRSAAFSIGVLRGLHEEQKVLTEIDLISAVSGGSYALSWLLLQPYYYRKRQERKRDNLTPLAGIYDKLFDPTGLFQLWLESHARLFGATNRLQYVLSASTVASLKIILSTIVDRLLGHGQSRVIRAQGQLGDIGISQYRNSIQQTYHALPESTDRYENRKPRLEKVPDGYVDLGDITPVSFPELAESAPGMKQPFFVINATVWPSSQFSKMFKKVSGEQVFELTPLGVGSGLTGWYEWWELDDAAQHKFDDQAGYLTWPLRYLSTVNVAPAISGAAISAKDRELGWAPRLGIAAANLGLEYPLPFLRYADPSRYLSDGAHCENLGALSLLRRKVDQLLIVDAEQEPADSLDFKGYGRLKDLFEAEESINELTVDAIDNKEFSPSSPVMRGSAIHSGGAKTEIWYLKMSMDKDRRSDYGGTVTKWEEDNKRFPHESTADQNYPPEQFRAYRDLGTHIALQSKELRNFAKR